MSDNNPSNERLADVYDPSVPQLIVVWPSLWWHPVNGDWILRAILADGENAYVVREGRA